MAPCMGQHEWTDLIELGMHISLVRTIADFDGDKNPEGAPVKPGKYAVDWRCCDGWFPNRDARGWFNTSTNILVDKNVVDR
jgi:hypothetical protein